MEELKRFIKQLVEKSFFWTKIINPGDIADPIVEAIKGKESPTAFELTNAEEIITPLQKSLENVERAIIEKEITESVKIENTQDISSPILPYLENIAEVIRQEISKLDKEVVVKNDISKLFGLFKTNHDRKSLENALKRIEKAINDREIPDYEDILYEISQKIPQIDTSSLVSAIENSRFVIPDELIKDGRIKVEVDRVGEGYFGGGGTEYVSSKDGQRINPATEETQQQILNALGGGDYAIRMASSGGYDYFGYASPGTASSAASWKIKRMDSNGIITWADGNASFDNVWDNHSSLTYL